ncbi:MAG: type IV pilus assembly protein PilM [Verrucomicrobiaceae bacterium]|nr:type IV pilus assembly protein PilM [Verrucomicrobiaceae bacterium]
MADSKSIAVINLGSQRVSGAVFGRTGGGDLILKRQDIVDMDGDPSVDVSRMPQLRIAVQELVAKLKIKGQTSWYTVAGHTVFTRFVKLPPVAADKVGQIVEFEAKQNVPFPIDEVTWDYEFISEPGSIETEVVLVAMKTDALNEIHEQVVDSGVKPVGVDLAPAALYNAFRYNYPDADEPVLIIDLGARSTNLIFAEEGRFFTRNLLVGGAAVTNAIAKEFGVSFHEAESQKCSQGFVALGGAVEDHPDEAINAMSKVMRNSMTRLHSEVMRTINYYKAQQGGSAPRRVLLAGGGAAAGYVNEFFAEKLKLPVEIFDSLRGVQIDRGTNEAAARAASASMGELVGLALRSGGGCPCELDLVPDAIATARDASRRAPALIVAGLCLFGALGAGIFWNQKATEAVEARQQKLNSEAGGLIQIGLQIQALDAKQAELVQRGGQLQSLVNERSWWVRLLNDLNQSFSNDVLWLTVIEPLKDGKPLTQPLWGGSEEESSSGSAASETKSKSKGAAPTEPKYELRIRGLYRMNSEGDQQVVTDYAAKIAKLEHFGVTDFNTNKDAYLVKLETSAAENLFAYPFEIKLPLKNHPQFK